MKITDIKTFNVYTYRTNYVFVKIETDEGISGIGEGLFSPDGSRVFFPSPVSARVAEFMRRHGGRQDESSWQFDYDFGTALHEAERTGRIPDVAST